MQLILFLLLSWTNFWATLGVLELPTIMFISSTHSHIEGAHLLYFTDFDAPFVFTLIGNGHIEVISINTSSWTLVFKVILLYTSSCENPFNNISASCVKVKLWKFCSNRVWFYERQSYSSKYLTQLYTQNLNSRPLIKLKQSHTS